VPACFEQHFLPKLLLLLLTVSETLVLLLKHSWFGHFQGGLEKSAQSWS
jgi:hypothetical protein